MVGLDRAALQNVGIDGALSQEADAVELIGLLGEDVDKLLADNLALRLRIGHAGQLVQEAIHRVHIDEVGVHLVAEDLDHLLGLALAQQAVVYMHAGQLLADGLDEQRGHDGRVHTAGQGQKDLLIADLLAQGGNLLVDKSLGQFGRGDARHALGAFVVCHRLIPPYFFIITMAI